MPPKKALPVDKARTTESTTRSTKGRGRQTWQQTTNTTRETSDDKTCIKSEADKVSKNKAAVAKGTPNPKTPKNDAVDKATVVPANYRPYSKTTEAGNKTTHKACVPANFKPYPKTSTPETGNNTADKARAPANFKPYPKTLLSDTGNNTTHKARVPANFKQYPKGTSEINKDDQLTSRNASGKIDNSDSFETSFIRKARILDKNSNTPDTVVNTRTDLSAGYSSRAGEFNMKTVQNAGKDSTIHVDNLGLRRVENLYGTINETSEILNKDETETTLIQKVYKDNPLNRRLGRVGKPIGSVVVSKKTKYVTQLVYLNTATNRRHGRVGKPRGSMPIQKLSATTKRIPEILEKIVRDELEDFTIDYDISTSQSGTYGCTLINSQETMVKAFDQALCQYNRREAELSWQRQSEMPDRMPKTLQTVLEDYDGKNIPFSDLTLYRKIGQGGFGEVYFAKWCETIVAVKKLKQTKMSDEKISRFAKEIMNFCSLKNPNIVKFIGACTELPHICVIMEYMQMSLYDAIHVRNDVDFSDSEKTSIVIQVFNGVKYLHASRIAHCDLKTMNVLLDYVEGEICEVKIADFGLSIVKDCASDSSSSFIEVVRNAGTPRYSAPEVLRGEALTARDMMKADVYSLSLIFLEVLSEQEPFPNYDRQELFEQVGRQGKVSEIPDGLEIDHTVLVIIQQAWSFKPQDRPDIGDICDVFRRKQNVYAEEVPLNIFD